MNERPIERLNYYNGQRLESRDLKLEQDYHMRVRRWTNRSLYTSGIAQGLTVSIGVDDKSTPIAIVNPGMALDFLGREIILVEDKSIQIPCGTIKYLTIRYDEETAMREEKSCAIRSNPSDKPAWGGPARIAADPILEFCETYPADSSGRIVLCLLDDTNSQKCIDNSVRRYIIAIGTSKVREYAIEGERSIDEKNPGMIHFHIRGRQPNAVTLYLKAEPFLTLFYTEMGNHDHGGKQNLTNATTTLPAMNVDSHFHSNINGTLGANNNTHEHTPKAFTCPNPDPKKDTPWWQTLVDIVTLNFGDLINTITSADNPPYPGNSTDSNKSGYALRIITRTSDVQERLDIKSKYIDIGPDLPGINLPAGVGLDLGGGSHSHTITGITDIPNTPDFDPTDHLNPYHKHQLNISAAISSDGVTDASSDGQFSARSGDPLIYVKNLKVRIGKVIRSDPFIQYDDTIPCTDKILQQIADANPSELFPNTSNSYWTCLGDGTMDHLIVRCGTGPIRLDLIPFSFDEEGEYVIELSVQGAGNGGRILYNLYVE